MLGVGPFDPEFNLRPTPLPYLTGIIKPRVKNYRMVRMYILNFLTIPILQAEDSVFGDMADAERVLIRAQTKQDFIHKIHSNTAPLDLKREIFRFPFDKFYEACREALRDVSRGLSCDLLYHGDGSLIRKRDLTWLLDCAMHPSADIDGILAPELQKYKDTTDANTAIQSSNFEYQVLEWEQNDNIFPDMTWFLRNSMSNNPSLNPKELAQIIGHFLQSAMDAVDVYTWGIIHAETRDVGVGMNLKFESLSVLEEAWINLIQNPYSDTSRPIRNMLCKTNLAGNNQFLLRSALPSFRAMGYQLGDLHYALYSRVIATALQTIEDENLRQATFTFHRQHWPYMTWNWVRPSSMPDIVTAELAAKMRPYISNDEMVDIPVIPRGPRVDARGLSQPVNDLSTDAGECPICRGNLADGGEPGEVVKLGNCGHLLHLGCLDGLLNTAYPGVDAVRCPACRARLCAPRDYEGVLDDGP